MVVVAIILLITLIIVSIHNHILKKKIDYLEHVIVNVIDKLNEYEGEENE
jgi:hypothetical protein